METGGIARPQQAASVAPAPRIEAPAAASGVKTELRPEASVQQSGEDAATRFEARPGLQSRVALDSAFREAIDRGFVVDEETSDLVFQAVDEETGEVVRQLPDEAMLKLRAYLRQVESSSAGTEVETKA